MNSCKGIMSSVPIKIMQHIQDTAASGITFTFTFSHLQTLLTKATYKWRTKQAKKHSQGKDISVSWHESAR